MAKRNRTVAGEVRRLRKCGKAYEKDGEKMVCFRPGELLVGLDAIEAAARREREVAQVRKDLDEWEWTTLVAAWRYYEHRHTIASAMFPADIVERFWSEAGMKAWTDDARDRIARQFVYVDHASRGENDWPVDSPVEASDSHEWRRLYGFLRSRVHGGDMVTAKHGGTQVSVECYRMDNRWYPVAQYVANPRSECWIPDEFVVEVR